MQTTMDIDRARRTGREDGQRWAAMQRDESGHGSSDERLRAHASDALRQSRRSTSPEREAYEAGFMTGVEAYIEAQAAAARVGREDRRDDRPAIGGPGQWLAY